METIVRCSNPACRKEIIIPSNEADKQVQCTSCRQWTPLPRTSNSEIPITPSSSLLAVDSWVGKRVDRFEILGCVGHGGMGVVYRVRDVRLNRIVALKFLTYPPDHDNEQAIQRFLQEARAAASLKHPNVVTIYSVGEVGGTLAIEMEYVDGGSLDQVLKRLGRLAPLVAARVVRDCAAGLSAAHAKGIVHRDIKPSNILLEVGEEKAYTNNESHRLSESISPKLCDFGLARLQEVEKSLTREGAAVGTPYYMSPEQCRGQRADERSDLYALGGVFYHLVTGRPPFVGESSAAILYKHLHEEPVPADQIVPDFPKPLAQMISKLMAKHPEDRFQTASEFIDALDAFLGVSVRPVQRSAQARVRLRKPVLWASGLLVILALTFTFFAGYRPRPGLQGQPPLKQAAESASVAPPSHTRLARPTPPSPAPSFDGVYVATAATGEKIPHPLSRKTYTVMHEGKAVEVPEGMAFVPGGPFVMGGYDSVLTSPAHEVDLPPFFIGKYEVTNAEYMEFVKATGYALPRHIAENNGQIPKGRENHPVTFVSWYDAQAFCQWAGKRLPSEAEWEKAASWDPRTRQKLKYPWGNNPERDPNQPLANWAIRWGWKPDEDIIKWCDQFFKSERGRALQALGGATTPVGSFPKGASPYQCYDMAGNILEWTQDWYDKYPGNEAAFPAREAQMCGQTHRVCRGGRWYSYENSLWTITRGGTLPDNRSMCIGFRCVADFPWKR